MSQWWSRARLPAMAAIAALLTVVAIDLLTNSIDTERFSWDFRYYIDMAERGLVGPMASPFAYRYLTPLLVRFLANGLGLSTEAGFRAIAYTGAITQLLAVFLFTRWYARSDRGAWLAMVVTAFSLFNVKFLLFDIFRPDHLAYPLVFLQAYFALTGRFTPLLISTIIGCQIREFSAAPLIAYVFAEVLAVAPSSTEAQGNRTLRQLVISVVALWASFAIPRELIPVTEDFQYADLSRGGMMRVLLAPLVVSRDVNFLYTMVAYMLPVLILAGPRELARVMLGMNRRDRIFLAGYTVIVLLLSFHGGTDFFRFATYLLLPQAVFLGLLAGSAPKLHLGIVVASVFVFNRIWLPFPMSDLDPYLDFYGGWGARFNHASVMRILECVGLIGVGQLTLRLMQTRRRPRAVRL